MTRRSKSNWFEKVGIMLFTGALSSTTFISHANDPQDGGGPDPSTGEVTDSLSSAYERNIDPMAIDAGSVGNVESLPFFDINEYNGSYGATLPPIGVGGAKLTPRYTPPVSNYSRQVLGVMSDQADVDNISRQVGHYGSLGIGWHLSLGKIMIKPGVIFTTPPNIDQSVGDTTYEAVNPLSLSCEPRYREDVKYISSDGMPGTFSANFIFNNEESYPPVETAQDKQYKFERIHNCDSSQSRSVPVERVNDFIDESLTRIIRVADGSGDVLPWNTKLVMVSNDGTRTEYSPVGDSYRAYQQAINSLTYTDELDLVRQQREIYYNTYFDYVPTKMIAPNGAEITMEYLPATVDAVQQPIETVEGIHFDHELGWIYPQGQEYNAAATAAAEQSVVTEPTFEAQSSYISAMKEWSLTQSGNSNTDFRGLEFLYRAQACDASKAIDGEANLSNNVPVNLKLLDMVRVINDGEGPILAAKFNYQQCYLSTVDTPNKDGALNRRTQLDYFARTPVDENLQKHNLLSAVTNPTGLKVSLDKVATRFAYVYGSLSAGFDIVSGRPFWFTNKVTISDANNAAFTPIEYHYDLVEDDGTTNHTYQSLMWQPGAAGAANTAKTVNDLSRSEVTMKRGGNTLLTRETLYYSNSGPAFTGLGALITDGNGIVNSNSVIDDLVGKPVYRKTTRHAGVDTGSESFVEQEWIYFDGNSADGYRYALGGDSKNGIITKSHRLQASATSSWDSKSSDNPNTSDTGVWEILENVLSVGQTTKHQEATDDGIITEKEIISGLCSSGSCDTSSNVIQDNLYFGAPKYSFNYSSHNRYPIAGALTYQTGSNRNVLAIADSHDFLAQDPQSFDLTAVPRMQLGLNSQTNAYIIEGSADVIANHVLALRNEQMPAGARLMGHATTHYNALNEGNDSYLVPEFSSSTTDKSMNTLSTHFKFYPFENNDVVLPLSTSYGNDESLTRGISLSGYEFGTAKTSSHLSGLIPGVHKSFDRYGRVEYVQSAGVTKQNRYDYLDRVKRVTTSGIPDTTIAYDDDALTVTTAIVDRIRSSAMNALGEPISQSAVLGSSADSSNVTSGFEQNAFGETYKRISPNGIITTTQKDVIGRTIHIKTQAGAAFGSANGAVQTQLNKVDGGQVQEALSVYNILPSSAFVNSLNLSGNSTTSAYAGVLTPITASKEFTLSAVLSQTSAASEQSSIESNSQAAQLTVADWLGRTVAAGHCEVNASDINVINRTNFFSNVNCDYKNFTRLAYHNQDMQQGNVLPRDYLDVFLTTVYIPVATESGWQHEARSVTAADWLGRALYEWTPETGEMFSHYDDNFGQLIATVHRGEDGKLEVFNIDYDDAGRVTSTRKNGNSTKVIETTYKSGGATNGAGMPEQVTVDNGGLKVTTNVYYGAYNRVKKTELLVPSTQDSVTELRPYGEFGDRVLNFALNWDTQANATYMLNVSATTPAGDILKPLVFIDNVSPGFVFSKYLVETHLQDDPERLNQWLAVFNGKYLDEDSVLKWQVNGYIGNEDGRSSFDPIPANSAVITNQCHIAEFTTIDGFSSPDGTVNPPLINWRTKNCEGYSVQMRTFVDHPDETDYLISETGGRRTCDINNGLFHGFSQGPRVAYFMANGYNAIDAQTAEDSVNGIQRPEPTWTGEKQCHSIDNAEFQLVILQPDGSLHEQSERKKVSNMPLDVSQCHIKNFYVSDATKDPFDNVTVHWETQNCLDDNYRVEVKMYDPSPDAKAICETWGLMLSEDKNGSIEAPRMRQTANGYEGYWRNDGKECKELEKAEFDLAIYQGDALTDYRNKLQGAYVTSSDETQCRVVDVKLHNADPSKVPQIEWRSLGCDAQFDKIDLKFNTNASVSANCQVREEVLTSGLQGNYIVNRMTRQWAGANGEQCGPLNAIDAYFTVSTKAVPGDITSDWQQVADLPPVRINYTGGLSAQSCELLSFEQDNQSGSPLLKWQTNCTAADEFQVRISVSTESYWDPQFDYLKGSTEDVPAGCELNDQLWQNSLTYNGEGELQGTLSGQAPVSFMAGGYGNNCPRVGRVMANASIHKVDVTGQNSTVEVFRAQPIMVENKADLNGDHIVCSSSTLDTFVETHNGQDILKVTQATGINTGCYSTVNHGPNVHWSDYMEFDKKLYFSVTPGVIDPVCEPYYTNRVLKQRVTSPPTFWFDFMLDGETTENLEFEIDYTETTNKGLMSVPSACQQTEVKSGHIWTQTTYRDFAWENDPSAADYQAPILVHRSDYVPVNVGAMTGSVDGTTDPEAPVDSTCVINTFEVINKTSGLPEVKWDADCYQSNSLVKIFVDTVDTSLPAQCKLTGAFWDGNRIGHREIAFMAGGYNGLSTTSQQQDTFCPKMHNVNVRLSLYSNGELAKTSNMYTATYPDAIFTNPDECSLSYFSVSNSDTSLPQVTWNSDCDVGDVKIFVNAQGADIADDCKVTEGMWSALSQDTNREVAFMAGGYSTDQGGSNCPAVGEAYMQARTYHNGQVTMVTNWQKATYNVSANRPTCTVNISHNSDRTQVTAPVACEDSQGQSVEGLTVIPKFTCFASDAITLAESASGVYNIEVTGTENNYQAFDRQCDTNQGYFWIEVKDGQDLIHKTSYQKVAPMTAVPNF